MEQCFAAFDRDGDGFMTVEDFGLLCRTLFRNEDAKPYDIEDQQIKDIFDVFDLNEDIVLDVDEFRLCWQHWIKKVVRPCSALLVVDVQNDFISGSLSVSNCPAKHNGEEVLEPINMMVNEVPFHYVFYTMDWHPSSHVSFVENVKMRPIDETSQVKAEEAAVLDTVIFAGPPPYEQKLWPTHCVQNSWGAELHKDLVVAEEGMFIHKGEDPEVDFYSAFLDNKRTTYTKLDDELKRRRVTDVYCCGLAHDICVGKTAIDAVDFGYRTVLVDDACRGVSLEDIQCTNETLQKKSAVIVSSSKVRNMVRGLDRRPELGYHCAMMLKGKLPTLTPPKSPLSPSDFQRCMHLDD